MANPHQLRSCPTRTDGVDVLFAHKVTQGHCQERQRNRYHKCFTCAFNNARVALHGLPPEAPAAPEQPDEPAAPSPLPAPVVAELELTGPLVTTAAG